MQYVITNVHGSAKAVHLLLGFVNRARRNVMISSIKLRTLFCAALGFHHRDALADLLEANRKRGLGVDLNKKTSLLHASITLHDTAY